MASCTITVKFKWWVRPYLTMASVIGAAWNVIARPDDEAVEAWVAKWGNVVIRHGIITAAGPMS